MKLSKTKLVMTYGPSIDDYLQFNWESPNLNYYHLRDKYHEMVSAGVDVIRFNMSHDSFEAHEKRFNMLRELNSYEIKKISIMIDTKGPEIRVGNIQDINAKGNIIKYKSTVTLYSLKPELVGDAHAFSISDSTKTYNMSFDVNEGDKIYIDDGKLVLEVTNTDLEKGIIVTQSLTPSYVIKSNKRVNLYNKKYNIPFISNYDELTIQNAIKWGADYLALSFVSNRHDILEVQKIMKRTNMKSETKIIAKIENHEAIENIEEILDVADGVMIARGDLAMEIGYEKVPLVQEQISKRCYELRKICIIATQMLESLETNKIPTRAESNDCYIAVKENASATMLSGETANGNNPINAIKVMKNITDYYDDFFSATKKNDSDWVEQLDLNSYDFVHLQNPDDSDLSEFASLHTSAIFLVDINDKSQKIINNLYHNIHFVEFDKFEASLPDQKKILVVNLEK